MVKKYPAKVVSINNSIEGVYTLELESMGKAFKYDAGQFLHLAVDEFDSSAQWPDSRCFSMQSAPGEEVIRITYAAKGQFTKRMQDELKVGSDVTLKLPYGDLFTQDHNKTNTVFISGGTGITPFLSLFSDASFASYTYPVLYAGFRNEELNLYREELAKAKMINQGFKVHLVFENKDGILDIEKIYTKSAAESSFFISGPPMMIKTFKQKLIAKGVPENQVLTDDWE
jgi:nitric oxide dioxygenase